MHNQVITATDYLTWESAADDRFGWSYPVPEPQRQNLPEWFRNLRGNLREYLPEGAANDHTVRYCRGMQGLQDVGYTMALPESIGGGDSHFVSGKLHPEMLHGTPWAQQGPGPWPDPTNHGGIDTSPYVYRILLLHWPWRARMAPGWRMLFLPNLWHWDPGYNVFSAAPRPYISTDHRDGKSFGSRVRYETEIMPGFNYHNIETVVAVRRDTRIDAGSRIFTMVPICLNTP